MKTASRQQDPHAQISDLFASWTQAVLAKDVPRILNHYTDDVLAYDAVAQLQFQGRAAYQAHWQTCMEQCSGPGFFEPQTPHVEIGGDLGLAHFLCHCGGTDPQGQEQSCWMRATQSYRRVNGEWLIAHEHFSMPVDMQSGKALSDLQP